MSNSLQPHRLQHASLPCPSLSPRVGSNSYPLSRWCHPTISSFVIPFSSCPQSFPASGSFPVSQFFASDGQSIGASASVSVLPVNIQGCFPLGLTGLISLLSKGLLKVFSSTTVWKHQLFGTQPSLWSTLTSIYDYCKNHSFDYTDLCQKSHVFAIFNTLSRFVIPFHPRNKACLVDAVLCLVVQSCLTLWNSMDCSLRGSSVYGDSPGKNTGVGCHALLQGIFPTQKLNPGLPHWRQILYHLSHQGIIQVRTL